MFTAALAESFRRGVLQELSIKAYEAAGGLEGAIDSAAESAFACAMGDWTEASVRLLILALVATDRDGRLQRARKARCAAGKPLESEQWMGARQGKGL